MTQPCCKAGLPIRCLHSQVYLAITAFSQNNTVKNPASAGFFTASHNTSIKLLLVLKNQLAVTFCFTW